MPYLYANQKLMNQDLNHVMELEKKLNPALSDVQLSDRRAQYLAYTYEPHMRGYNTIICSDLERFLTLGLSPFELELGNYLSFEKIREFPNCKFDLLKAILDGKAQSGTSSAQTPMEVVAYVGGIERHTVETILVLLSYNSSETTEVVSIEEYKSLSSMQLNALVRLKPYGLTFQMAKTLREDVDYTTVSACQALFSIKLEGDKSCQNIEEALQIVLSLSKEDQYILSQHRAHQIGFGYTLKDLTSLTAQQKEAVTSAIAARDTRRLSFLDGFNQLIANNNDDQMLNERDETSSFALV